MASWWRSCRCAGVRSSDPEANHTVKSGAGDLADVYFHFVALSPSERQAVIDLVPAIRAGRLELVAEKITELRPGEPPRISHKQAIPANALADPLRMKFDMEYSRASWKNPRSGSYFTFEGITAARDRVIALRPGSSDKPTSGKRGRKVKFSWDLIKQEVKRLFAKGGLPAVSDASKLADYFLRWCDHQGIKEIPQYDTIRLKIGSWLTKGFPHDN